MNCYRHFNQRDYTETYKVQAVVTGPGPLDKYTLVGETDIFIGLIDIYPQFRRGIKDSLLAAADKCGIREHLDEEQIDTELFRFAINQGVTFVSREYI